MAPPPPALDESAAGTLARRPLASSAPPEGLAADEASLPKKKLVSSFAEWIKENEPKTLSYQLMCSDKEPLQVCILERYEDKSYAYAVAHKTSPEFFKFRPALAALEPVIDGHSYYESGGGFIGR